MIQALKIPLAKFTKGILSAFYYNKKNVNIFDRI